MRTRTPTSQTARNTEHPGERSELVHQHRLGARVHLYAEAWPLGHAHAIARRAKPCQVLRSVERRGELEARPGEHGRTEGNPFFLEESVRTLVETQVLVGERGAYRLAQALPSIQVPATVQAVLAARIDRLPPDEKHLLQAAAVIGKDVPAALLQATVEVPWDDRAALPRPPAGRGVPLRATGLPGARPTPSSTP